MIVIPGENESETEYFLRMSRLIEAQKQRYADMEKIEKLSEFMDPLEAHETVLGPVPNEVRDAYLKSKEPDEKLQKDIEKMQNDFDEKTRNKLKKEGWPKEKIESFMKELNKNKIDVVIPDIKPSFNYDSSGV